MDNNPYGDRFFMKAKIMDIPLYDEAKIAKMQLVLNAIKNAIVETPTYKKKGDKVKALFSDMKMVIRAMDNGTLKLKFVPHNTEKFVVALKPMVGS